MVEGMQVYTSMSLTGFETLLLCSVIGLTVEVCSIQREKPLQKEAIAKLCLPMAFLGQTEERESQFPQVRLLVMIKDDKYVGWENFIALNVIRLFKQDTVWNGEPV